MPRNRCAARTSTAPYSGRSTTATVSGIQNACSGGCRRIASAVASPTHSPIRAPTHSAAVVVAPRSALPTAPPAGRGGAAGKPGQLPGPHLPRPTPPRVAQVGRPSRPVGEAPRANPRRPVGRPPGRPRYPVGGPRGRSRRRLGARELRPPADVALGGSRCRVGAALGESRRGGDAGLGGRGGRGPGRRPAGVQRTGDRSEPVARHGLAGGRRSQRQAVAGLLGVHARSGLHQVGGGVEHRRHRRPPVAVPVPHGPDGAQRQHQRAAHQGGQYAPTTAWPACRTACRRPRSPPSPRHLSKRARSGRPSPRARRRPPPRRSPTARCPARAHRPSSRMPHPRPAPRRSPPASGSRPGRRSSPHRPPRGRRFRPPSGPRPAATRRARARPPPRPAGPAPTRQGAGSGVSAVRRAARPSSGMGPPYGQPATGTLTSTYGWPSPVDALTAR